MTRYIIQKLDDGKYRKVGWPRWSDDVSKAFLFQKVDPRWKDPTRYRIRVMEVTYADMD